MGIKNYATNIHISNGHIFATLNYWQNWNPSEGLTELVNVLNSFIADHNLSPDWGTFVTESQQFSSGFTVYVSVKLSTADE